MPIDLSNGIALAALLLSIISIYLNRHDRKARLRVIFDFETIESDSNNNEYGPDFYELYSINIINPSDRRITISSILFEWRKHKEYYPGLMADQDKKSSFVLLPRENNYLVINPDELFDWLQSKGGYGMKIIRICVIDATGRKYYSNKLKIDVPR